MKRRATDPAWLPNPEFVTFQKKAKIFQESCTSRTCCKAGYKRKGSIILIIYSSSIDKTTIKHLKPLQVSIRSIRPILTSSFFGVQKCFANVMPPLLYFMFRQRGDDSMASSAVKDFGGATRILKKGHHLTIDESIHRTKETGRHFSQCFCKETSPNGSMKMSDKSFEIFSLPIPSHSNTIYHIEQNGL